MLDRMSSHPIVRLISISMKTFILFLALNCFLSARGSDLLDSSGLPVAVTSELRYSEKVKELQHREEIFKVGDTPLMLRGPWLESDGKTIVRTVHRLLCDKRDVVVVYVFQKSVHHEENHSSITHFIPNGARLMTSQGDIVSRAEWRVIGADNRVLASFVRESDGLIRPRTRAEFDEDQSKREAVLSRK